MSMCLDWKEKMSFDRDRAISRFSQIVNSNYAEQFAYLTASSYDSGYQEAIDIIEGLWLWKADVYAILGMMNEYQKCINSSNADDEASHAEDSEGNYVY